MKDEDIVKTIFDCKLNELGSPPAKSASVSWRMPITWMEALMCSLECHNWCLLQNMMEIDLQLQLKNSKLFDALEFFINEIVCKDLSAVISCFCINEADEGVFSPKEILEYNWMKCTVLVRIFTLFISLDGHLENYLTKKLYKDFWSEPFFNVILLATIDPSALGFDTTDVNVTSNLSTEMLKLLKTTKCGEKSFYEFFQLILKTTEEYNIKKYLPLNLNSPDVDHVHLCELLSGLTILAQAEIWPSSNYTPDFMKPIAEALIQNLWDNFSFDNASSYNNWSPFTMHCAQAMLLYSETLKVKEEFLIAKLLDSSPLQSSSTSKEFAKRGLVIYSLFEEEISEIICRSANEYIIVLTSELDSPRSSEAMALITKFLNKVSTSKNLQKQYGTEVLKEVLKSLPALQMWCEEHSDDSGQDFALSLLTSLLILDSKISSNDASLFRTYTKLLRSPKKGLDFKVHVLDLLPFFIEAGNSTSLRNCLDTLIVTYFPLDSKEFLVGSSQYNAYSSAVKKLLTALDFTGSSLLLEILSILFCKEEKHFLLPNFEKCLNSLIKRLPAHSHQELANVVFQLTKPDGNNQLPADIQFALMERVCLALLRRMALSAFTNFYIQNIKFIMDTLMQRMSFVKETKQRQLVAKIGAFKLLELLYNRLHKDQLHTVDSQIVEAYVGRRPDTGKELTTDITKTALEFKKEKIEPDDPLADLSRKFCCASYNSLVAIVSCTQTDIKFYNAFIFKENLSKGEQIWECIVDPGKNYSFDIEHDETANRKKQFVSIRHSLRHGGEETDEDEEGKEVESSFHMMASQYLAMSSLADDVSKFDFSTTEQVFSSQKRGISDNSKEGEIVAEVLDLEEDALNMHECVAPMSFLFKHMLRNKLISEDSEVKPSWLDAFVVNMESHNVNKNIKLFLARVITNNSKIFKVYGKFLLKPLMNLIVSGTLGTELNYFILDIILTMLSWAPEFIPEANPIHRHDASSVLEFLMRHCSNARREIFRNNLEIIKTLMECWKGRYDIPYSAIYEQMKNTEPPNKDSIVGIQLLGVALSSGLPCFTVGCENEELSRLTFLVNNLRNKYKEVYASAAEVIGLILKSKLEAGQSLENDSFYSRLIDRLMSLRDSEVDKFLVCLHTIHKHYSKISCRFLSKLLYIQPSVHGIFQTYVLDLLCSCILEVGNGYSQLKSIGIFKDIEHKEESLQHILLEAIGKVCLNLSSNEILHILPSVTPICQQPSSKCRLALFKILMSLFDNYRNYDGAKEKEIVRISQETLLKALADSDESIRLTVDNFWSSEERLPISTKDRLLSLMRNMYSPPTEDAFLQYATFLLLERTSHSPDYKRKIFEHPLSECNFLAYNITTSWRQRFSAMTPMFVDSMSSSSFVSATLDATNMSTLRNNDDLLRATQDLGGDFSATHNTVIRSSTFNWLTNKSMDTLAEFDSSANTSGSESSNKSHLFTSKKTAALPVRQTIKGTVTTTDTKGEKEKSSVWLLRRRFLKDRSLQSDSFARREIKKKDIKEELQQEQKRRREAEVTMYRQYRIGELPDIEIPNSALIAPLQALAQHDAFVAKLLFKSLVVSICKYIEDKESGSCIGYTEEICQHLCQILRKSTSFTPTVISFSLESLYQFDGIVVESEDIFVSSLKSNQQSLGISLLESKILKSIEESHEPKRKKVKKLPNVIPESTAQWIKLAWLHRSVYDYDNCNGIFSKVFGAEKQKNQEALELEARGYFAEALQLYETMYEAASEETDQAEKDFLDNSLLFCYDRLTEWQKLDTISVSRFTETENIDLQRVWEEPYFIDNYLPYVMRSKVKCLIDGVGDQSLLSFIDESSVDEDRKSYLEEHFVEELALLYIIQEKFDSAGHYSNLCLQRFLKEWKNLSSLATNVQQSKLQCLQKYIELGEFIELMKKEKFDDLTNVHKQAKVWEIRSPSVTDPPNIWEDVTSNRQLFLKKLEGKCSKRGAANSDNNQSNNLSILDSEAMEVDQDGSTKYFSKMSILQKLSFSNYCALKNNIPAALKQLKTILKEINKDDASLWSNFITVYCLTNNRKAQRLQEEDKLESLLSSWTQLGKMETKFDLSLTEKKLQSQSLESIADMFANKEISLSGLKPANKERIREIIENEIEAEVVKHLHYQSFSILKNSVSEIRESNQNQIENTNSAQEAFLCLANFCNKYLRMAEAGDSCNFTEDELVEYAEHLIGSLLSAIHLGNMRASQLFPRLLQVIELYKDTVPIFMKKVEDIPCWMFLGWVNQLVALLDKPEGYAVHSIVQNICKVYPNAILYAFRLSSESYGFSNDVSGKKNKTFVDRIKSVLNTNTLISDFIAALNHLSVPHLVFKDYMVEFFRIISPSNRDLSQMQNIFKEMWTEMFDLPECGPTGIPIGPIQKEFAEQFSEKVIKLCGKDGSGLFKKNADATSKDLMALFEEMKKKKKKGSSLKCFSPWMSDFRSWKYDTHIEIPGQYTGKSKPLTEYHVKIAGFDEKVLVLSSITLPRRITIRGNDEKDYKILVKAGEDLRQDSRIQQLFLLMNDIYQTDPECGKRHLKLATYKVIPLSSRLGLIEWVDSTIVLNDFLNNAMTEAELARYQTSSGYNNIGHAKIVKLAPAGFRTPTDMYISLHDKRTRDTCVKTYEEIVGLVPSGLLKRSFIKLSSSLEAYMRLRNQFSISHAVICISQWLLGIGDRHLGNFLIDTTSGQEIGIDFGHAFGSATQFLTVPELVPFRLTPQYLQLLLPLKERGLMKATMVHALAALQKNRDLLLNIMDIFIKEPTLDWKTYAAKQQQTMGMTDEEIKADVNWYPKQRVAFASKKLQGANPCHIMNKELLLGHGGKAVFNKFQAVCMGDPVHNVRAQLPFDGLTVEQQVNCLIDQATDPHLLCKTYFGWNPWM